MWCNRAQRVALALVLAGSARPANAAELVASGPRECADAGEISSRVERSIGMSLAQAAPLAFDVVMERTASAYVARIAVAAAAPEGARFTRELSAPDCGKLADALSVAVALALGGADANANEGASAEPADAERARAAGFTASRESAVPAAAAPNAPADAGDDASSATAEAALAPSISLWLLGDAGSLPRPSLGAAIGAELGWPQLELRAIGSVLFERETQLEATGAPAPGAKLQLITGGLHACAAPFGSLRAPLSPVACIGAEVGQLSGVGTGVASPRRGRALWAAPLVQVGAAWRVPDTAVRLSLSVLAAAPLTRDEFALRDLGTVHRPPSVIARLSLGVELAFD